MTSRNGHGQIERSIDTARLDAEAAEMRANKIPMPEIAAHQGCSLSTAYLRVKRAIEAVPYEAVTELRRLELEALDADEREVRAILAATHYRVDHGKVIEIAGQPMIDHAPKMQAIDRLVRIREQRAKYTGAFQPEQHEVTVRDGDSDLDREIAGLLEDMGRLEQGSPTVEASEPAESTHT